MFVASRPVSLQSRGLLLEGRRTGRGSDGDVLGRRWEWGEEVPPEEVEERLWTPEDLDSDVVRRATSILRGFCSEERYAQFRAIAALRTSRVSVAFERPSNPHNVWACLRTVDAVGIQQVDLVLDDETSANQRARNRGIAQPGAGHRVRRRDMLTAMG